MNPEKELDLQVICRNRFEHAHQLFIQASIDEMVLHNKKNKEYTQGGDKLGNFNRTAAIRKLYPGFPWSSPVGVAMSYLMKSMDAVMWGLSTNRDLVIDTYDERLADVGVYIKIMRVLLKEGKKDA